MLTVEVGESFAATGDTSYTINPYRREDYHSLLGELSDARCYLSGSFTSGAYLRLIRL